MIFASLARPNKRVQVHNERNLPQAKLDSEINVRFLVSEHGNLYFYCVIIVYILPSLIKKNTKNIGRKKKDVDESVQKSVTLGCGENNGYMNALRPCSGFPTCQVFFSKY